MRKILFLLVLALAVGIVAACAATGGSIDFGDIGKKLGEPANWSAVTEPQPEKTKPQGPITGFVLALYDNGKMTIYRPDGSTTEVDRLADCKQYDAYHGGEGCVPVQ